MSSCVKPNYTVHFFPGLQIDFHDKAEEVGGWVWGLVWITTLFLLFEVF